MEFIPAVKQCLTTKYMDFKGRAPRSEYWWFYLFYTIATFPLTIVDTVISELTPFPMVGIFFEFFGLFGLFAIAIFLPFLGVMIRRLHDRDKSGWWLLASYAAAIASISYLIFTPYYESFLASIFYPYLIPYDDSLYLFIPLILLVAVTLILNITLLVWFMQKGTSGNNRFGPDPLASPDPSLLPTQENQPQ